MELCQIDHNVFVRHRDEIRDQEQISPDEKLEFAQDVDALVRLAKKMVSRGRVCIFVTPLLNGEERTKLLASLTPNHWSAQVGESLTPEFEGQFFSFHHIRIW